MNYRAKQSRTILILLTCSLLIMPAAVADTLNIELQPGSNAAQRLIEALRMARAQVAEHDVEVVELQLTGGVYELEKTLTITPDDLPAPPVRTVIRGNADGMTRLTGGLSVGPWVVDEKTGVWRTQVPAEQFSERQPHSLFINGKRAMRARFPNQGYLRIAGNLDDAHVPEEREGVQEPRYKWGFKINPDNLPVIDEQAGAMVTLFHSWRTSIHPVARVDPEAGVLLFTDPMMSKWRIGRWDKRQRYWLENVPAALDAPGEWYWDANTGELTYMPRPGEDPATATAIMPRLTRLLNVRGHAKQPVRNLRFENVTFEYTDWTLEPGGNPSNQGAVHEPSAITVDDATQIAFERCVIRHTGGFGLWLRKAVRNATVEQCLLTDIGAGAIRIGQRQKPKPADATSHFVIDNNIIRGYGQVFHGGQGVLVKHASDGHIQRNEVSDGFYSGMQIGYSWHYGPSNTLRNVIEGNYIHHIGHDVLNDMGGIYTLGQQNGAVIRNNLIHDVDAHGDKSLGWGIYLDQASHGITVERNLAHRTTSGGIMNTSLPGNEIRHNIFADAKRDLVWRFGNREPRPETPTRFHHNILLVTQGDLFNDDRGKRDTQSPWNHNLYWRNDGKPLMFYDMTFEQWQASGRDAQSLMADPLFIDPASGDYRLQSQSPAFTQLQIQPIDSEQVGVYGDPQWIELAEQLRQSPLLQTISNPK